MEAKKKKFNIMFYINFVVATIAITELFTSNKYFAVGNDERGYLVAGISFLVFIASLFLMAFQIYSEEKEKDNLRVSFAPFDLIYNYQGKRNIDRHCETHAVGRGNPFVQSDVRQEIASSQAPRNDNNLGASLQ